MNKGIDLSNSSWFFFIGPNDYIFTESTFEEISRVLQNTSGNVVYGNVLIKGNSGWANDGDIYDGKFTLEKILKKNICHQAIFYRRDMFQNYGNYNINYSVCADYDLNLRFFAKSIFEFTPVIVAIFRGGGASTSIHDENFFRDKNINVVKYFIHYPFAYLFKKISMSIQITFLRMLYLKFTFVFLRLIRLVRTS